MDDLVIDGIPPSDNNYTCMRCDKVFNPDDGWQIEEHKGTTIIFKFLCCECKDELEE